GGDLGGPPSQPTRVSPLVLENLFGDLLDGGDDLEVLRRGSKQIQVLPGAGQKLQRSTVCQISAQRQRAVEQAPCHVIEGEQALHVGVTGTGGELVVVLDDAQSPVHTDLLGGGRDRGGEGQPGVLEVVVDGGVGGHALQIRGQVPIGLELGHRQ